MRLHDDARKIHDSIVDGLDAGSNDDVSQVYRALSSIQRQALCTNAAEYGRAQARARRASDFDEIRRLRSRENLLRIAREARTFILNGSVAAAVCFVFYRGILSIIS